MAPYWREREDREMEKDKDGEKVKDRKLGVGRSRKVRERDGESIAFPLGERLGYFSRFNNQECE